jgi:hypothetical protein
MIQGLLISIGFPLSVRPDRLVKGNSTAFKELLQPRRLAIFL